MIPPSSYLFCHTENLFNFKPMPYTQCEKAILSELVLKTILYASMLFLCSNYKTLY